MQEQREKLQLAVAKIVKHHRTDSITKCSNEINLGKSIWSNLEQGVKDPQLSTLWRIAEGLNIKPHQLIKEIEEELGENFSFLEETL